LVRTVNEKLLSRFQDTAWHPRATGRARGRSSSAPDLSPERPARLPGRREHE
jgi:hypothetical protein